MTEIPTNGSYVTWRELNLALDPLKGDVKEIGAELTEFRAELRASRILSEQRAFLGQRGRGVVNGLLIALPAALVSVLVTVLFNH